MSQTKTQLVEGLNINTSAPADALAVDNNGRVGIGITSPDGNVHIADSTRANLILKKTGLNDVTNSSLHSTYDVIQLGAGGSFASYNTETSTADTQIGHNFYRHSGGNQKYKYADAAVRILFNSPEGATIFSRAAAGSAGADITFSESLRIDSAGNVGIGTTAPQYPLHVNGQALASSFVSNSDLVLNCDENGNGGGANSILFRERGNEKMRMDGTGRLLVGTTNASQSAGVGVKLTPTGQVFIVNSGGDSLSHYSSTAGAYRFYVGNSGAISSTSGTITVISDQRFKENIRDLDDGLSKILALQPRKFDWKEGKGSETKDERGFIAQEFEQVFPDLITEWKDPAPDGEEPYKAVRADLIPVLVKAIQEQQNIIEGLEARLAALESA